MKRTAFALAVLLLLPCLTYGQDAPATRPAGEPAAGADGGKIVAKATLVLKRAYARTAADAPWKRVKVGDTFGSGAEFRTGFGAKLVLTIGENSVVLIKSLTQVVLETLVKTQDTVVTKLNLSQGRMRAGVTKGTYKSDFTISSPIASLSVRGTYPIEVSSSSDMGFRPSLGKAGLLTVQRNVGPFQPGGRGMNVQPGEATDDKLTPAILLASFGRMRRAFDLFYKMNKSEAGAANHLAQIPVETPKGFTGLGDPKNSNPSAMGSSAGILRQLLLMRGLLQLPPPTPTPIPTRTMAVVPRTQPGTGPDTEGGGPTGPFKDKDPFGGGS